MESELPFADIAALIADPSRAVMLGVMLGGGAYTASELAARAGVAPSTASDHLTRLRDGGLISRASQGRYRFFRLASPEVAKALESLGALKRHRLTGPRSAADLPEDIRFARSCYDHLAGWLGVTVTQALIDHHLIVITDGDFEVTPAGSEWLEEQNVKPPPHRAARRFARRCLDWTEKRPHLAGVMGAALLSRFLEVGWLQRWSGERTLDLTPAGQAGFHAELGLSLNRFPNTRS